MTCQNCTRLRLRINEASKLLEEFVAFVDRAARPLGLGSLARAARKWLKNG